jgi:tetratricopeptide (TPR) repeat protein
LALAAGTLAIVLGLDRSQPGSGTGTTAIAVFPFDVRGGEDLRYLGEGLVDLLSVKLDGAPGVRSVDPRAVLAAVSDEGGPVSPREAARVAGRLRAGAFVVGDIVELAGRITLSAAIYDVRDGSQAATTAGLEGDVARLPELVDELAARLLAGRIQGRDTVLTRVAALTTRSLPALKAFLEGERAFRAGQVSRAEAAFREAISLDTAFALAHYRLSIVSTWVSTAEGPDPHIANAMRHAQRLTPLARDLLTAYRAYRRFQADTADMLYSRLVLGNPDNLESWLMLGETRFHLNPLRGRPPSASRAAFERVLALDPRDVLASLHLARLAAFEARTSDVEALVRAFLAQHAVAERTLEMRALRAFVASDSLETVAVLREARRADELTLMAVLQAAMTGAQDMRAALGLLPMFTGGGPTPYWLRVGRRMLSEVPLAAGVWDQARYAVMLGSLPVDTGWTMEARALMAADPVFSVRPEDIVALRDDLARGRWTVGGSMISLADLPGTDMRMRSYLVGLLSLRLGDTADAHRRLADLERLAESPADSGIAQDLVHGLRAELARSSGEMHGALAHLERFRWDPSTPRARHLSHGGVRERFLYGEVLRALGRVEEAAEWYASLSGPLDVIYAAPSHLRLGEIRETQGDLRGAEAHYRRFVTIWRDCDGERRSAVARIERKLSLLKT